LADRNDRADRRETPGAASHSGAAGESAAVPAASTGGTTTAPGANRLALPLDDLYREVVLDHYRRPRGRQPVEHASCRVEGFNPSCGDQVRLAIDLDGERVNRVQVDCQGCSISVASGSMMAELVEGRSVAEVRGLVAAVKAMMQGRQPDPDVDLGDIEALEGVRKFPVRVKCALLAWTTLDEAIAGRETVER
jgi:nitrogen fixation protein NifU and related proteins